MVAVKQQVAPPSKITRFFPPWWTVLITVILGFFAPYKLQSATIGFCDTGSSTNAILQSLEQTSLRRYHHCNVLISRALGNQTLMKTLQSDVFTCVFILPVMVSPPLSCASCPSHADCTPHSATCRASFVKKPNLLSLIPYANDALDGWPYFGSVAFPPSCIVDPAFKAKLKAVGRDAELFLAIHRGKIICGEGKTSQLSQKGQVLKYGIKWKDLNDMMRKASEKRRKNAGVRSYSHINDHGTKNQTERH